VGLSTSNLQLSHELPDIMKAFLRNGDTCDKVVAEALQVGTQSQKELMGNSSLPLHDEILDKLGRHFVV
jgi:hypothetical protein